MSSREDKALTAALVGAGVLVAAPGLVAAPMLGVLGFGSLGPGAGTAAALIQSLIGNVARGSFFAMLQSAGMGGAGAMALNAIISGIGLTGAALVALYKCLKAFFGKKGDGDGADGYDGGDDAK
ncbi:hypothetical protein E4U13_003965 [Claviceps humidiphila]|uniref:Uncharacterized protein n=1 Tax=Claviceps humidiphila TaxID=1294629 RepID=A0A9P7PY17_9HYPO|nr:hypothetical protein E4U13_003965 [Claviceps humidiphila]